MYRKLLTLIFILIAGTNTLFAGSFGDVMGTEWVNGKFILFFMYFVILMLLVFVLLLYRISSHLTTYRRLEAGEDAEEVKPYRFWERFFQVKSVKTDRDVMLDHDYDGIKELDNPPPPWFMYLFYGTILIAVIYFIRFQVTGSGPTQQEEYIAEVEKAEAMKMVSTGAESAAGENITEANVEITADANNLKLGKLTYGQFCATCHGQNGEGLVGPNLTDDYWMHGGSIKDVFKTIKYGVIEKGMTPWGTGDKPVLTHKQIRDVASYIATMDEIPAELGGKPPYGKLYVPVGDSPAPEAGAQPAEGMGADSSGTN